MLEVSLVAAKDVELDSFMDGTHSHISRSDAVLLIRRASISF